MAVERDPQPAVLRVRVGAGNSLRRRARTIGDVDDDWSLVDVDFTDAETFAEELAGFGPDVVVEQPPDLQEAVIRRLKGAMAEHEGEGR